MPPKRPAHLAPRGPEPAEPAAHAWIMLAVATIAVFAPFLGKPLHIDDPMYVWAAQHIVTDPLDFYGVEVNWYGFAWPMAGITKNPPLYSYWLALIGALFGWSEYVLHLATLPFAVAAVLATARLGTLLGIDGPRAALGLLIAPLFVVSGTTLMCDVPMLACWLWSLCLWIEAVRSGSHARFAGAVVLAGAAALCKYFGASVLLLLALHLACTRGPHRWRALTWLCVPLALLAGYEWLTVRLYGAGLFGDAMRYAAGEMSRSPAQSFASPGTALAFLGAGLPAILAIGWIFTRSEWLSVALLTGVALAGLRIGGALGGFDAAWLMQQVAAVTLGAMLLVAMGGALLRERSATGLLLGAWVGGTLVFAAWVNWSVSARALLPMLPAASLLVWRRAEGRYARGAALAMLATLLLAMSVAFADYRMAGLARQAARDIAAALGEETELWFQGHWGFQYYMQQLGARPMDMHDSSIERGAVIAVPPNNSNYFPLPREYCELERALQYPARWVSVMNEAAGAGFYTDMFGKLPFVFAEQPAEQYLLFRVHRRMLIRGGSDTSGTSRVPRT